MIEADEQLVRHDLESLERIYVAESGLVVTRDRCDEERKTAKEMQESAQATMEGIFESSVDREDPADVLRKLDSLTDQYQLVQERVAFRKMVNRDSREDMKQALAGVADAMASVKQLGLPID